MPVMSMQSTPPRTAPHPRRPAAHQSVSLRHRQPPYKSPRPGVTVNPTPRSDYSSLLKNQNSSGESSNAENWFDQANTNVARNKISPIDDDPPFYLDNSPTYGYDTVSLPLRPTFAKVVSDGSSSEDYRGVIDDLTIENKRLKAKLKRYEGSYDSQLNGEKLFEVRMHGLAAEKKRELEETLRKFALSLDDSPVSNANDSAPKRLSTLAGSALKANSTLSSARVADSGYGSMSASGQASAAHSNRKSRTANPLEESQARHRSIQSYLSDIPEGLLPRHPVAMSEKEKKKEVVRRLEQIFGGRGAAPGMHQQPMQQQEVSQSAANAEKSATEAQGHEYAREGMREARIMDTETEDPMDFSLAPLRHSFSPRSERPTQGADESDGVQKQDFAASPVSHSPEQRPTRPLDLDPHRAQIPSENVEYIRHLGFSLPDADAFASVSGRDGWLYLNLLISMAQLHTLNVTTSFIKQAVTEYSNKFELSSDGRKVRWSGGKDVTRTSSNDSSDEDSPDATSRLQRNDRRKRRRPVFTETEESLQTSVPARKKVAMSDHVDNPLFYKPLFPPKDDTDIEDDLSMSVGASLPPQPLADVDPRTSSETAGLSPHKYIASTIKRHDDGPIIFYNNSKFYTDLSGCTPKMIQSRNRGEYPAFTSWPLGAPREATSSNEGSVRASHRPLITIPVANGISDNDNMFKIDFDPSRATPKRVTFADPEEPLHFEVSGIGGIRPEDNMAITVMRQHMLSAAAPPPRPILSSKLRKVLPTKPSAPRPTETLLSARHIQLPPSALPPASYAFDDEESSVDSDSVVSETGDISHPLFTMDNALPIFSSADYSSHSPCSTTSELDSDEDEDTSDDGSLDFLATARAVNPAAIRAKEREYDAEMADRLAEEIPAGSSAATAGGGSGYNTPMDDRGEDDGEEIDELQSVSS